MGWTCHMDVCGYRSKGWVGQSIPSIRSIGIGMQARGQEAQPDARSSAMCPLVGVQRTLLVCPLASFSSSAWTAPIFFAAYPILPARIEWIQAVHSMDRCIDRWIDSILPIFQPHPHTADAQRAAHQSASSHDAAAVLFCCTASSSRRAAGLGWVDRGTTTTSPSGGK